MEQTKDIAAICERLLGVCAPKSIRIRVEVLQSNLEGSGDKRVAEFPIKQEYSATSSGQRYFDDVFMPLTEPSRRTTVYSDGHKFAHVWYVQASGEPTRQSSISFNKNDLVEKRDFFVHAPEVVRLNHVGLEPLYEALPRAVVLADGEVIGRSCDVFHFEKVGRPDAPQSLVYFLDKSTAVPLKVSAYENVARLQDQAPSWVWVAKSLDPVSGGHFLPLSSIYTSYLRHGACDKSEGKIDLVQAIRIVLAEFDTPIPASTFWPVPQPGVPITDMTLVRPTTVSGVSATVPEIGAPIRADTLADKSAFFIRSGVILSAIIAFLIAFVLWRRSR